MGLFADAIRTLAAIIVIVTIIQQMEPNFSLITSEFENTLLILIENSHTLSTRTEFYELLRDTIAELNANSSPRDFYNLYEELTESPKD